MTDVQVYFRFERGGVWPPVPSEGLRAEPLADGSFRLRESPFFVRNVAVGDVVRAEADDGVLWAGERVSWGGHQTLRVTTREAQDGTTCSQVLAEFAALGVDGEELEEYELVTLDVAGGVDVRPVKDLLVAGRDGGRWWYEEACIGPAWPG